MFSDYNVKINPTIMDKIRSIIGLIRKDFTISRKDQTEKIKRYFQLQIYAYRNYKPGSAENRAALEKARQVSHG